MADIDTHTEDSSGSRANCERTLRNADSALPAGRRCIVFLTICLILVYGLYVVHEFKSYTFALYDPGWMVSTVMSIVEDRDLDLRNQLHDDPAQAADQTSQGTNGEWYPLHEFLMPIVTVPFYLAFGIYGCLIFNVVISILLMILVFQLCVRHVEPHSAFTATVLTAFPSLFLTYSYSYSLDVFSAFVLILAYWCAVSHRHLLAGFVWGLAVYTRLANAVTIVGFIVFLILETGIRGALPPAGPDALTPRRSWMAIAKFLSGGLPVGVCFAVSNWLMFGSPVTTSYDRWQHFVNGQAVVTSQRAALSGSFVQRLPALLLDQKSGLLIGAPLILVAIAFGLWAFWVKARSEAVFMIVTCLSLVVLYAKYTNAVPGTPGNRYLMPVVALCSIPLAFAIDRCFQDRAQIPG